MPGPILIAEQLRKTFIAKKGMGPRAVVEAVRGVDLKVGAGEVLALGPGVSRVRAADPADGRGPR